MYICMLGYIQIESLDRGAVFRSIPLEGQAAPLEKRDHRRSDGAMPVAPPLVRRRTSAGLSQFFVERYQENVETQFPFFRDRFGKAVLFSFYPSRPG